MKNVLHYVLVFLVAAATPHFTARAFPVWLASFSASPQAWTAAFETNPANTDSVSQADDHMRQIKGEVRERLETEMDFGELGNVTTDTGRNLEGSARAFRQNTAPTADGSIGATCLAEADYDGNRGCDDGRLFIDADGPDNTGSTADDNTLYVSRDTDSDGDADSWAAVPATLPTNSIILWDASNTCPPGFSEATEFRQVGVRGADIAGASANIPNSAGVTCGPSSITSGAANCNATNGINAYNDDLEVEEMPSHDHNIGTDDGTGTSAVAVAHQDDAASSTALETELEGGARNHIHPIRTVLFCRKS
jgi:hypothetical protein